MRSKKHRHLYPPPEFTISHAFLVVKSECRGESQEENAYEDVIPPNHYSSIHNNHT